jgi:hypothetical protein
MLTQKMVAASYERRMGLRGPSLLSFFAVTFVLAACGGKHAGTDTGNNNPGSGGGDLSNSDGGAGRVACTPAQMFCSGSTRWTCNLSGTDANSPEDCSAMQSSASNPFICATSQCPAGTTACCRPTNPLCVWTQTDPVASMGTDYGGGITADLQRCSVESLPTSFTVEVQPAPPDPPQVHWQLDPTKLTSGSTIDLPNSAVQLDYYLSRMPAPTCTITSGKLTWTAPPSWALTVKDVVANCTYGASPMPLTVNGSYSGTL